MSGGVPEDSGLLNGDEHEDVRAVPVRYWWLKRVLLGCGVFVVLLVGLRLWWGWHVNRKLGAEIDRIVAAGEPLYPEDFSGGGVPDGDNVARLYQKGVDEASLSDEDRELLREAYSEYRPEHAVGIRGIVDKNRPLLELARRARGLERADWGVVVESPVMELRTAQVGQSWVLYRLLLLDVRLLLEDGDESEAVEVLLDALRVARALDVGPSTISHTHSWFMYERAAVTVERIASSGAGGLQSADHPEKERRATDRQIQLLIDELLREKPMGDGLRRVIMFERMLSLDVAHRFMTCQTVAVSDSLWSFGGGKKKDIPLSSEDRLLRFVVLGPTFAEDAWRLLHEYSTSLEAVDEPCFQKMEAVIDSGITVDWNRSDWDEVYPWAHALYWSLSPDGGKSLCRHYCRTAATRRMAATALAVRLYERAHGVRLENLDELVGDYLPRVPMDPFMCDSKLGYVAGGEHRRLYSVGQDCRDDGGEYVFTREGRVSGVKKDLVFFLDEDRSVITESTRK